MKPALWLPLPPPVSTPPLGGAVICGEALGAGLWLGLGVVGGDVEPEGVGDALGVAVSLGVGVGVGDSELAGRPQATRLVTCGSPGKSAVDQVPFATGVA